MVVVCILLLAFMLVGCSSTPTGNAVQQESGSDPSYIQQPAPQQQVQPMKGTGHASVCY